MDEQNLVPGAIVGAVVFSYFGWSRLSACVLGYVGYVGGAAAYYAYRASHGLLAKDPVSTFAVVAVVGLLVGPAAGALIQWGKDRRR